MAQPVEQPTHIWGDFGRIEQPVVDGRDPVDVAADRDGGRPGAAAEVFQQIDRRELAQLILNQPSRSATVLATRQTDREQPCRHRAVGED
jgi:hypothetical protein